MNLTTAGITPEERLEILRSYRKLLRAAAGMLLSEDVRQIRKAIETTLVKNGVLRLPSGKPSVLHSLEVARITVLAGIGHRFLDNPQDLDFCIRTEVAFQWSIFENQFGVNTIIILKVFKIFFQGR